MDTLKHFASQDYKEGLLEEIYGQGSCLLGEIYAEKDFLIADGNVPSDQDLQD